MNITAKEFKPYYEELYKKFLVEDFVIDKSGVCLVELIAPRIELSIDENIDGTINFETRKTPLKYLDKELAWYNSHELNIDRVGDIAAWQQSADRNGEINSNYGNLVFSKANYSQFDHALNTLVNHKESRQGIIIYTRPSIQMEWNALGASDFICTNYQHFMIRNDTLICITNMRSQDVIFGAFNDIPWFFHVYNKMLTALRDKAYPELKYGKVIMLYNSFHCYERHFPILKAIAEE